MVHATHVLKLQCTHLTWYQNIREYSNVMANLEIVSVKVAPKLEMVIVGCVSY